MITRSILPVVFLQAILLQGGFGQVQPNDNFADRIVLSGDNVTFAGDLSGSTVEANEPLDPACCYNSFRATRSVWWSWTAIQSGPVTLVALGYSQDTYVEGLSEVTSALAMYPGTNVFVYPEPTPAGSLCLNAARNKLSDTFYATAGTEYQIRFFGAHPTLAATFQMIASDSPVILEPPTDQTVLPGGSALFSVLAVGLPPLRYQWRLNGTNPQGAPAAYTHEPYDEDPMPDYENVLTD